jgi:anaerobic magnesium-protoporphyrin IX monomethyl ester cyclase
MEKSIDVLLINPTRIGTDSYCTQPLHLMYLSKALHDAGFSVKIINVHEMYCKEIDDTQNDEFHRTEKQKVETLAIEEILKQDAKLIGIGSICTAYEFSEKIAIALKSQSNVPIIIGGSLGLPLKDLWYKYTKIDYICESDGERVMVDLVKNLGNNESIQKIPGLHWRTDKGWIGNPPDLPLDLDYISAPDIREIDYEFYIKVLREWVNKTLPPEKQLSNKERPWSVVFSRGCIYDCMFCFHFNRKHRKHSIGYIINYMRYLRDKFGITVIVTWDDLIMANPKWFMDLCDGLANANLGIKIFTSGGKANIITEPMAKKMASANFFRVSFGIESGSQTILNEMKKCSTVEDNKWAIKVTTDAGIFVHLNMVIGMPSETKETLEETYNFIVEVSKENKLSMQNISFSYVKGYPGTQLFDYMVKKSLVDDTREYILTTSGVGYPEPVLCNLTVEDLKKFLARVEYAVNDIHLTQQGHFMKRIINRIAYSSSGQYIVRYTPTVLKDYAIKYIHR